MSNKMKKLLYRSFDTPLGDDEHQRLRAALASDEQLRKEQEIVSNIRRDAVASAYRPFHPEFAEQVLARILNMTSPVDLRPDLFYASLIGGFRKLAWAGGLAAFALITLHLLGADALSLENVWALSDFSIQELLDLSVY